MRSKFFQVPIEVCTNNIYTVPIEIIYNYMNKEARNFCKALSRSNVKLSRVQMRPAENRIRHREDMI